MKLKTLSVLALTVAALSAHATGLNQNGNSNAGNVQAPPPVNQGPTTNNGIGIGVQSSAAGTGIATANGGKGGKASAKGGNAAQGQSQKASAKNRNAQEVQVDAGSNASQLTVGGANYEAPRIPVSTAFAAGLVASYGTCLGSASGGVQGSAIGLSFGTTTLDQGCHLIRRMNALIVMGMPQAALTLACIEDDAMYTAIRTAGYYCAEADRPVAIAYPVPAPAALSPVTYIPRGARNDRN